MQFNSMIRDNEFITIDIYNERPVPLTLKQPLRKVRFELDNSCGGPLNLPYQPEVTQSVNACLKRNPRKPREPRLITPSPYETCRLDEDQKERLYLRENTNLFIV